MYERKEQLLEDLLKALPYSDQIVNLDFSSENDAIRFKWRSNKFRVDLRGGVDQVNDGVLIGDDISILLRELLKRQNIS